MSKTEFYEFTQVAAGQEQEPQPSPAMREIVGIVEHVLPDMAQHGRDFEVICH
jgi:hypothetical protein